MKTLLLPLVMAFPAIYVFGQNPGAVKIASYNQLGSVFIPDSFPRFPGCEETDLSEQEKYECANQKLRAYISKNVKWPEGFHGEGTVVVTFTAQIDGTLTDLQIVHDPGGGCGEEVIRVVRMMPRFVCTKKKSSRGRAWYRVPVAFKTKTPISVPSN